jgi:hypothetical protein
MLADALGGLTCVRIERTLDPVGMDGQTLDGPFDVRGEHAGLVLYLVPLVDDNLPHLLRNALGDTVGTLELA